MSEQRLHVTFAGHPGFPVGFGAIQRMFLIAKGLVANGSEVMVLSYKGTHGPEQEFPAEGTIDGVPYRYTSGSIHAPRTFFRRNWLKLAGKIKELTFLRKQRKNNELDACLISTMDFDVLLLYWLWLKIIGVPLILDYVELNSAITSRTGWKRRINDYFFDRFAVRLADGVTPISEYLQEQVQLHAGIKPTLKLPILCDFDKFAPSDLQEQEIRFVYCGAASYRPVIDFVLKAFSLLDLTAYENLTTLELILGGKEHEIEAVRAAIAEHKHRDHIRLVANVPHHQIPDHYAKASALLIPMRPTVQDAARFPHKLGEYLASGCAVITTRFGEIRHYPFTDGETTLVAPDYDPASFAEKMDFVAQHPDCARSIGRQGRKMGLENFEFKLLGSRLKAFLAGF